MMKLRSLGVFLGLLLVVLGFLFWDMFRPETAGFANDAPLGLMKAYSDIRWEYFFGGSWMYHFWIGGPTLSTMPNFSHGLYLLGGAVFFAKMPALLSMSFLGLAVWLLCRGLGLGPVAAGLAGLAAALNGNLVSHATWGLGSRAATVAFAALALASVDRAFKPGGVTRQISWLALAGFFTGMTVMEGADVGSLFSLLVGAYVAFCALLEAGSVTRRATQGALRLAVVVACAIWISAHALTSLVGTQIQGVAVMGESPEAKRQRWDFVTGWSFPKLEVVRIAVPGIMGYRMDTPAGGAYWGNVGQDGTPQTRFNGGGEYAGVLVLIVAGWAVARAVSRSERQPYSDRERRLIGFWAVVCGVSLLLSFGRFAPFYQVVYALPYLSTIRIPMKFLHVMHLGLFVLFAYGLQGLWRLYVEVPQARRGGVMDQVSAWWRGSTGFDRRWARALAGLAIGALVLALFYAGSSTSIAAHIAQAGFPGEEGKGMAGFSVFEAGVAAGFVVLCAALLAVVSSGRFSDGRGTLAAVLLGSVLVVDLGRAAVPFIQHYDYQRRYASNPVLEFLARNPWEHRVTARYFPDIRQTFTGPKDGIWPAVQNQWMEQQFPFHMIHTADIWQMPRMPELDASYLQTFRPKTPDDLGRIGRMWQLANVRYVITAAGFEAELNRLFDPEKKRFKPVLGFDLVQKPGSPPDGRVGLDDITAVVNPSGQYAVVENGAALPRARLYSQWEILPDDAALLKRLEAPAFDPESAVLLGAAPALPDGVPMVSATNAVPGTASITQWKPKQIRIQTTAASPSVLLLNDRWDAAWRATVDGREMPILRANHLMRGVAVPAGDHTVEFVYAPPMRMLWVTLSAMAVALGIGTWLALGSGKPTADSR